MSITNLYAGVSKNAISAEAERSSQVCRIGANPVSSCRMSESLISDEVVAHLILYGLIKSKVDAGEISADCLEEYVSSFNRGEK